MKHSFIIMLSVVLLIACNSKPDYTEKLKLGVETHIKDEFFKQNIKLDLLEINGLTYEMAGVDELDSFRLAQNLKRWQYCTNRLEHYTELARLNFENAKLSARLGVASNYKDEGLKYTDMAQNWRDTADVCRITDSLITGRIKTEVNSPKDYYKAKFLLRGRAQGKNMLDTTYAFFDKNLQYVDLF